MPSTYTKAEDDRETAEPSRHPHLPCQVTGRDYPYRPTVTVSLGTGVETGRPTWVRHGPCDSGVGPRPGPLSRSTRGPSGPVTLIGKVFKSDGGGDGGWGRVPDPSSAGPVTSAVSAPDRATTGEDQCYRVKVPGLTRTRRPPQPSLYPVLGFRDRVRGSGGRGLPFPPKSSPSTTPKDPSYPSPLEPGPLQGRPPLPSPPRPFPPFRPEALSRGGRGCTPETRCRGDDVTGDGGIPMCTTDGSTGAGGSSSVEPPPPTVLGPGLQTPRVQIHRDHLDRCVTPTCLERALWRRPDRRTNGAGTTTQKLGPKAPTDPSSTSPVRPQGVGPTKAVPVSPLSPALTGFLRTVIRHTSLGAPGPPVTTGPPGPVPRAGCGRSRSPADPSTTRASF